MIVRANIRFGLHSSFLDRGFEAEDERLPGESIEDGVLRIEAALTRAENILKAKTESMRGEIIHETGLPQHVPIVSTEKIVHDDTLELIRNAPDLKELTSFKTLANRNPDLYGVYCQRLKELTQ